MDSKTEYRKLCNGLKQVPLFLEADWMEAATKGKWDVVLAKKGNETFGAMPFHYKRKLGFRIITMPVLTPYSGPVLFYPENQRPSAKLSFEKRTIQMLVDKLPKTDKFIQYLFPSITNGLPFQWRGFNQTVRYTYCINDTTDIDSCWESLDQNIRRTVVKASEKFTVDELQDPGQLHEIQLADYKVKGLKLNFSLGFFKSLHTVLLGKNQGLILGAKDDSGKIIAGLFLGWDAYEMYYLSGAILPEYRNSGALTLLLWTAIKLAHDKGVRFNFKGSMIESVERYFRSFGAQQVPYYEIRKTDSSILKLV